MERKRVQVFFDDPSLTKQEFKNECDINVIMKKFKKICGADFLNRYNGVVGGQFGDFSEVPDFRTARDQVNRMEEVFMALPAKVRSRFSNDPAELLDFVNDPNNLDEARALGLAKPAQQDAAKTEVSTGKSQ